MDNPASRVRLCEGLRTVEWVYTGARGKADANESASRRIGEPPTVKFGNAYGKKDKWEWKK